MVLKNVFNPQFISFFHICLCARKPIKTVDYKKEKQSICTILESFKTCHSIIYSCSLCCLKQINRSGQLEKIQMYIHFRYSLHIENDN